MRGTPLRTSSQRQASASAAAAATAHRAPAQQVARNAAATAGRRITCGAADAWRWTKPQRAVRSASQRICRRPGQPMQRPGRAGIAELALGAQHEHRQALQRRRAAGRRCRPAAGSSATRARPRSWPAAGPWASSSRPGGPRPSSRCSMSCVSWPCRKLPRRRLAPGSRPSRAGSRRHRQSTVGSGVSAMRQLSSSPMSSTSKGSRWLLAGPIGVLLLLCALAAAGVWWWLDRPLAAGRAIGGAVDRARHHAARRGAGLGRRRRADLAAAALRMVPLVGPGAAHPRRQLRDRDRHHAARAAGQDGAGRRDAGDACA